MQRRTWQEIQFPEFPSSLDLRSPSVGLKVHLMIDSLCWYVFPFFPAVMPKEQERMDLRMCSSLAAPRFHLCYSTPTY